MAQIGKYELIEELGRGGYGTVHRAHDPTLGVDRAIKILHPLLNSDPEFILRFRKEARLVAQLRHPNIVPVIELGQFEGWMYLVMEYMSGGSLRNRLQDGALSYEESVSVLRQVGDGLAYAHENEVIHRDIKPENILFDNRGIAYLGDFGFARSLSEASTSTSMSLTGGVLGTPAYMAPEAWEGKGWSPTADLYSLGCVFVEMLSGDILFEASSPVEAMKKHVIDGPQLPEKWTKTIPEGLEDVLRKTLAKEASYRYQDMLALLAAVEQLVATPGSVHPSAPVAGTPLEKSWSTDSQYDQSESEFQPTNTEPEGGARLVEKREIAAAADRPPVQSVHPPLPYKGPPDSKSAPKATIIEKVKRNLQQIPSWVSIGIAGIGGIAILTACVLSMLAGNAVIDLFNTPTPTSNVVVQTDTPPHEAPSSVPASPTTVPISTNTPRPALPTEASLPDLGGREITIAVENAYLPFNYIDLSTGEAKGWDYDFIDEACARLNCTPVWVEFTWDMMIAAVAEGQFDMATDGITITDDRAEVVDFSDGYISLEQRLMVRLGEDRFTSVDEFVADENLVIGTQLGTTNYATAEALVGDDRIVTFDEFGLVVQALISGDVDAVIIDEIAGQGYKGEHTDRVELLGDVLSSDALGFIFPRGSDLVAPFNAVLDQMKADGSLAEINAKWFGPGFQLTYDDIGCGAYCP